MHSIIDQELSRQAELEARRAGVRARRFKEAEGVQAGVRRAPAVDVTIRDAEPADMPALMRLAELDSQELPAGRAVIAAVAGQVRAAIAVDDGTVIADPFAATAELQELLRLRALQIRQGGEDGRGRGMLAALHLRAGRAA